MIDTHDFAKLVAWRGQLQSESRGGIALTVAAIGMALLIAFLAAAPVSAHHGSPGTMSVSAYVAANPELSSVHRFLLTESVSESAFLTANPEISAVRRYASSAAAALAELDSSSLWDDLWAYDKDGLYRYGD